MLLQNPISIANPIQSKPRKLQEKAFDPDIHATRTTLPPSVNPTCETPHFTKYKHIIANILDKFIPAEYGLAICNK